MQRIKTATVGFSFFMSLAFFYADVATAELPQEFEATYKAKFRGISITAKRSLQTLEDGSQLFRFDADSWIADLKETSQFTWHETDRVIPRVYNYHRTGLGRDRQANLQFDWQNNTVINNVQRKPWQMEVPEFALDKLSYQLQLRADLINKKPLLEYDIADGGRLKKYRFEILGEEDLNTDIGLFTTVKVRRIREKNDGRYTVLWLAKDWDYMVVRLQQEEDSKSYEIDLTSAVLNGREVKGRPSTE